MGMWIIIWGGIALLAWLVSTVISASQKAAAYKHVKMAKEFRAGGNWEAAAALYKKAMLERLDNLAALEPLTRELEQIYETHGVDADLRRVLEAPSLIKDVWKTNTSPEERGRLTGKLYGEIGQLLERYPGKLYS